MPRFVAPLLAALAIAFGVPSTAQALEVGQQAPAFTLPALTGSGTLSNEDCRDKRAQLVIFWSSF